MVDQTNLTVSPADHASAWRYAGFWWRFLARIIDAAIIQVVVYLFVNLSPLNELIISTLIPTTQGFDKHDHTKLTPAESNALLLKVITGIFSNYLLIGLFLTLMIGSFIGTWLYFAVMESSRAQATLGKKVCNLRVTDINGKRLSFGRASGRYWARYLGPFLVSAIAGFLFGAGAALRNRGVIPPCEICLQSMGANVLRAVRITSSILVIHNFVGSTGRI